MKPKLIKLSLSILLLAGFLYVAYDNNFFSINTVRAFGDLTVDFHVAIGNPIFTIANMAPGDSQNRNIDVTNSGSIVRHVAVKGIKTGGDLANPKFETVLDLVIKDGVTPVYGAGSSTGNKTLAQFFTESNTTDGVPLSDLNPSASKTYNFLVTFQSIAGNQFQNRSLTFDLTFGATGSSDHVIINEVFYNVDAAHGLDSPADRGVTVGNITTSITNTGPFSNNNIFVDIENNCTIYQVNNSNNPTNVNININTGKNKANNNGGNGSVQSATASANVNITNIGNVNNAACNKGKKLGQNQEWVELYNPTDHDINLKNYIFVDNSGISAAINGNRILKSHKFALVSKANNTWNDWSEPSSALKIPLGRQIGDGLQNTGDRLLLNDPNGNLMDALSWGTDTTIFTIPGVVAGHSLERLTPGFDTDAGSDFHDQNPPTPGS
jgi:hypothetical protein